METMKVLYFHQHFTTPKGSTGIRSYVMSKKILQMGHEVTIVCGSFIGADTGLKDSFKNGFRRGYVDGIEVIELDISYGNKDRFFKRFLSMTKYFFKAIYFVFKEKYDLVFATSTPLTAGIPGIISKWIKRKPFIFEVRDLWPELPKEMGIIKNPIILLLMSILEWVSYKSADYIIALSPGIKDGIKRRGIPENKISMIPNGCDLDIFKNKAATKWRPKGVNKNDFIALFSGTHGIANDLNSILDAANELKKRGREDIKIILIGQGGQKSKLIQRATSENLDNVIFMNPIDKINLSGLMAEVDIGLQVLANIPAFYYGTSPNKFFDYISAGLPVINNYPGWLADIISHNNCGFVVPPENPKSFANALIKAADHKEDLFVMGHNSLMLAKRDFDRVKLANDWYHIVRNVHNKNNKK